MNPENSHKEILLIADSGSTKTEWVFVESSGIVLERIQTRGFNPYFLDDKEILDVLHQSLFQDFVTRTGQVWFYGSGCLKEEKKVPIRTILEEVFVEAKVNIESDLLGACRALFGNQQGIGAILGTGSSCAYYNGSGISDIPPSLGYILGDEGSGSYIGKILMKDILSGRFPEDLMSAFNNEIRLSPGEMMENLYQKPQPNRFLAGLAKFLIDHGDHPYSKTILRRSMNDFFESCLKNYSTFHCNSLGFCGSVAFHASDILMEISQQFGFCSPVIIQSPTIGLIEYHTTH